jgi:hypothetical protein
VLMIAMTRRRLRHCMSRKAADSILISMLRRCHGIASAQAMCPSKPSDLAMLR